MYQTVQCHTSDEHDMKTYPLKLDNHFSKNILT